MWQIDENSLYVGIGCKLSLNNRKKILSDGNMMNS